MKHWSTKWATFNRLEEIDYEKYSVPRSPFELQCSKLIVPSVEDTYPMGVSTSGGDEAGNNAEGDAEDDPEDDPKDDGGNERPGTTQATKALQTLQATKDL